MRKWIQTEKRTLPARKSKILFDRIWSNFFCLSARKILGQSEIHVQQFYLAMRWNKINYVHSELLNHQKLIDWTVGKEKKNVFLGMFCLIFVSLGRRTRSLFRKRDSFQRREIRWNFVRLRRFVTTSFGNEQKRNIFEFGKKTNFFFVKEKFKFFFIERR